MFFTCSHYFAFTYTTRHFYNSNLPGAMVSFNKMMTILTVAFLRVGSMDSTKGEAAESGSNPSGAAGTVALCGNFGDGQGCWRRQRLGAQAPLPPRETWYLPALVRRSAK